MMEIFGNIFNIQRYSLNDGPGIRTTVFMKGCPLRCKWCHNPESWTTVPELFYYKEKCAGCGSCAKICEYGCHIMEEGFHMLRREACQKCGACVEACCYGALEMAGYRISSQAVMDRILQDGSFYEASGGGVTFSGGEPMMQKAFLLDLLKKAKEQGLHVCLETCGYAKREDYLEVLPYVDLFLFDYKESDEKRHKEYTGVSNALIKDNLKMLNDRKAEIILRCPIIPEMNDRMEHFKGISELANTMKQIKRVELMVYHPLGVKKSGDLGKTYGLVDACYQEFVAEDKVEHWLETVSNLTSCEVIRG